MISKVPERFQPKATNDWVGVTGRSRVIVYNDDLVDDPPTSARLTDPKYEGQVAWVPSNASFQSFITAFHVSQGEDAARQWLEDMEANGAVVYADNTDVLEAVDAGQIPIGLINHYYWARKVAEVGGPDNMAAELIFPEGDDPGTLVNATAVSVPRRAHAPDDPAALEFVHPPVRGGPDLLRHGDVSSTPSSRASPTRRACPPSRTCRARTSTSATPSSRSRGPRRC